MHKTSFVAAALAGLIAAPAIAGTIEPPVVVTPVTVVSTSDWTGPYVGLRGAVYSTDLKLAGTPAAAAFDDTIYSAGVQAGYLYDMGDLVVGGEISYDHIFEPDTNHLFNADAIIGFDGGNIMPFLSVGGSYLDPLDEFGISGGAGINVLVTDNVMITARYRYIHFSDLDEGLHQGIAAISYKF